MVTKQLLKRNLWGSEIKQNNLNGFFSATDLVKAGNNWRVSKNMDLFSLHSFFQNKGTKEFMCFLKEQEGGDIKIDSKGKNSDTWVHPYLFIKIALAISPELEIKVYKWLYDSLVQYRNQSGDSYKKMCGSLMVNLTNKNNFQQEIKKVAMLVRKACGVSLNGTDREIWNSANENQLKLRDKIHEYIAQFADIVQGDNLYDVAIKKAKEQIQLG